MSSSIYIHNFIWLYLNMCIYVYIHSHCALTQSDIFSWLVVPTRVNLRATCVYYLCSRRPTLLLLLTLQSQNCKFKHNSKVVGFWQIYVPLVSKVFVAINYQRLLTTGKPFNSTVIRTVLFSLRPHPWELSDLYLFITTTKLGSLIKH